MKRITFILFFLFLTLVFVSCNKDSKNQDTDKMDINSTEVKITLLNSKGEIQAQLEEAAKIFKKENKNITLEIIPCPAGQSPFQKASSLYAAGNPPTLSMLDGGDLNKFKDKFKDLSNEKWVSDSSEENLYYAKIDNKIIAFPFTIEGHGLIYNKKILNEILGKDFEPNSIKTISALDEILSKLGKKSIILTPMDWSLGNHLLTIGYTTQSNKVEDITKFIDDLKAGNVDLKSNLKINGILDTLDVIKKYNIAKDSALAVTYEKGPEVIGSGNAAFWFMGCWAWPQIASFDKTSSDYGFIPVPISNTEADYGNNQLSVGVTKFIGMDKEKNTSEQQNAATKFLNWLVYEKSGQDFLVNKANIIPAFKNITLEPKDPLGKSIKEYMASKNTLPLIANLPPDHWSKLGAEMQKYVDNKISREELLNKIQEYWKTVK